ncbi:MAG: hypothetical protein COT45_01050 [bacterium (Candidatus Stahlbacteria) CG08_land_8_20_14_0_20_40_26]|nr:MAG: hypothetical protein COT45_01050 [bacterium (Candidatus Stahlbacteria) CG08_land_8_20_14_0_20_40_26]
MSRKKRNLIGIACRQAGKRTYETKNKKQKRRISSNGFTSFTTGLLKSLSRKKYLATVTTHVGTGLVPVRDGAIYHKVHKGHKV